MDKSVPRKVHLTDQQESEGIALDQENIRDLRAKDNKDDCDTQIEGNDDNDARNRMRKEEEKESITGDENNLEVVQNKYIVQSDNNEEDCSTERGSAVENRASNDIFQGEENSQDDANDDEYGDGDDKENGVADNEELDNSDSNGGGSDDDVDDDQGEVEPGEDIYETECAVNRIMQHLSSIGGMEEPQKEFRTFSAKLPDELDCLLTGVIVLGQFILVADNENKNVKRFSFGGVYVDSIDLEDPCGMCVLKGGADFIVTQPDFLKFTIVLGDIPLRRKCDISTERRYDCISSLADGNLVCGCCKVGKTCVDIVNQKGEVLISLREREDGSKLFRNPAAIATIKSGEIIVSDSGSNRLFVLTQDGSTEHFFETTGRPSGVGVDECGCVFVSHFDANTVFRYSPDGSKEDLLGQRDEKVKSPLALAVTSKYLVLTEEMPSDRIIVLLLPTCPVLDAANELAVSGIQLWVKQA